MGGGRYRSIRRDKSQIASRLCNKALRDHIVVYLPKIMHNAGKRYVYVCILKEFMPLTVLPLEPCTNKNPSTGHRSLLLNGCSGSSKGLQTK